MAPARFGTRVHKRLGVVGQAVRPSDQKRHRNGSNGEVIREKTLAVSATWLLRWGAHVGSSTPNHVKVSRWERVPWLTS